MTTFQISIDSQTFTFEKLKTDPPTWESLHYDGISDQEERKLADDTMEQALNNPIMFNGDPRFIYGQENIDRQIKEIFDKKLKCALIWFYRIKKEEPRFEIKKPIKKDYGSKFVFKRHCPSFIESDPTEDVEYNSFSDLLKTDFMKKWSSDKNFSHFAKNDGKIMAILHDGHEWWVVGSVINKYEDVSLPEWDHGKYKIMLNGDEIVVPGTLVASSCGDDITLKTGTTCKKIKH